MKTVLVVDDERLIRWALSQGLKSRYDVIAAGSAEEANYILARVKVDAVLTDLHMPGLEGTDFIGFLKSRYPHLQVFVISAYASEPVAKHLREMGVIESLEKPFALEDVIAMLDRHLDRKLAVHEGG